MPSFVFLERTDASTERTDFLLSIMHHAGEKMGGGEANKCLRALGCLFFILLSISH